MRDDRVSFAESGRIRRNLGIKTAMKFELAG